MVSIGVVRSSMAAASYFAKDNYYTQHEEGPSHWFGAGAEKLGLAGEVAAGRFKQLLEGRIDAETQLGRLRDGEHRAKDGVTIATSDRAGLILLQQRREKSDDHASKGKPGGRDADLGQERDVSAASRQQERDYDDDMGY